MDNFAANQLGWSKWRSLKPASFLVMTEARLQTKLETNSTDAKEQNTRAAAEQARSILYSEAWWFLRWYCLLGLIWPKTCFPTQRECLVSGNPTFSTTSHRTTTSAGVDFWRVWNLEWKSFCFLFLCFYQLVVCVFFLCLCIFSFVICCCMHVLLFSSTCLFMFSLLLLFLLHLLVCFLFLISSLVSFAGCSRCFSCCVV